MLVEKGVKAFDKYEKWVPKLIHDARFTAVPGQAERKALFEALAKRIDTERRKKEVAAKKGGREAFRELLAEAHEQNLFRDRTTAAALRTMEQRFGDDDRWDAVLEGERERLITEAAEEVAKTVKQERSKAHQGFRDLVLAVLRGKERDRRLPSWDSIRRQLEKDERWGPVGSSSERERLYQQVIRELDDERRKKTRRQRLDEEEAETARKRRRHGETEEALFQLLTERVKAPYSTTWPDVKRMIRDHARTQGIDIEAGDQEKVWDEYLQSAITARRTAFLQLLGSTPVDVVGPEMDFKTALDRLFVDSSIAKAFVGVPEGTLHSAWEEWRELAYERAVSVCRDWMRSCEHFRGLEDLDPSGPAFEALLARLAADVRFCRLGARPEEQRRLAAARLQELREQRSRARSAMNEEDVA